MLGAGVQHISKSLAKTLTKCLGACSVYNKYYWPAPKFRILINNLGVDRIMLGKLKKKYFLYVPISFLFLLGLTACQESERDRVLRYDKGTYLGAKDQSLNPEQLQSLQSRARYQFSS